MMKNIGPKSAEWLRDIGVEDLADLQRLGAPVVYRLVKSLHPQANLNLLYALEGAIRDRHWNSFSEVEKAALKSAVAGIEFEE